MITVGICIILSFLYFTYLSHNADKKWTGDNILLSLMLGFCVGGLLGCVVAFGVGALSPKMTVNKSDAKLVAFRDTSGLQGKFFLGSGYIESKHIYRFLYKYGDGIRSHQVYADDVVIYESNSEEPSAIQQITKVENDWALWPAETHMWRITIPRGSITNQFTLDLN